ncbi:hypothetical protein AVEN_219453-1 [Araneus ventricosus]|uniref:PiggyBac transposable element-derived protein domain-containing protein n=1 Tax=Araneus ventricosus TaxID=182803 RepID=A0A4Y2BM44_ARAVE|nr:hypothetical protein AVEN_219453-1 [Araneus ventricosus]
MYPLKTIVLDVYFCDFTVAIHLLKVKIDPKLKTDGRGISDKYVTEAGKITVVKWYGNRANVVKKCSKEDVTFVEVPRPEIVKFYNKSIGAGVDKHDLLMLFYRTAIRSKKWTLRVPPPKKKLNPYFRSSNDV